MKIIFASSNVGKFKEILPELEDICELISLDKIQSVIKKDLPSMEETASTYKGNAYIKADAIYRYTQMPTLADDSGIEVSALNGAPGVYSARYAGPNCSMQDNIDKVLSGIKNSSDKRASMHSFLVLRISESLAIEAYAKIDGVLIDNPQGEFGFGYDPYFIPNGETKTFAEIKNYDPKFPTHRIKALRLLREKLNASGLF